MTIRAADETRDEDDYTISTCLEHAGDILTMFTQHMPAQGRLAMVQAHGLSGDIQWAERCKCNRLAAFTLVHVYDDVPPARPKAEAGVSVSGRDAVCAGTHDGEHRDACVACGMKPSGVSAW